MKTPKFYGLLSLLIAIMTLSLSGVWAQVLKPVLPNNVPPSPTAAGLGQYGEIEVGHYSGLPNTSIPLYTYSQGGYDFGIALSYQNAGLRYLDEASYVGLGWSLNCSGVITRSIKWVEDLMPGVGYSRVHPNNLEVWETDTEPDIFYYNVNGIAGKFVLPYSSGTLYAKSLNQQDDTRIYLDANNNFVMTTPDGIIYRFEHKEMAKVTSNNVSATRISAWYLTRIELLNKEIILFKYKPNPLKLKNSTTQGHVTQTLSMIPQSGSPNPSCYEYLGYPQTLGSNTSTETDEVLLESIEGKNGKVTFAYSARNDIGTVSGSASRVQSISVLNGNGEIRKFTFGYGYFSSGNSNTVIGNRLKLLSVTETGVGVNNQSKVHSFYYNEGTIPDKTHLSGKYFGFYDTNPTVALLNKIVYPTKGYTEFTYQNHDYSAAPVPNAGILPKDLGVRIWKIANRDATGTLLLDREYTYTKKNTAGNPVSSGKLISYATNQYESSQIVDVLCNNTTYLIKVNRRITYSTSIVPLGGSSTVVGYDQVTVTDKDGQGNNGKSEYYYVNNVDSYSNIIPGLQGTHDYKNGTLTTERQYRWDGAANDFRIVREARYQQQYLETVIHQGLVYVPGTTGGSYSVSSFKSRPQGITETKYESTSDSLQTSHSYTYSTNYLQPEVVQTTGSSGKVERISKRYPYHFTSTGVYAAMVSVNQLNPVIEETYSAGGVTMHTATTSYRQIGTGASAIYVPDSIKTRKYGSPSTENRIIFSNYTGNGKLQHAKLADGPPEAYQWGHGQEFVVAEVTNGNNSSDTYSIFPSYGNVSVPITISATNSFTFTSMAPGDITLQLLQGTFMGSGITLSMSYTISGPLSRSGAFCMNNNPNDPCYYTNVNNNKVVISNAPAGTYTLLIRSNTTISGSTAGVSCTYMGGQLAATALKDFFYEGFEEATGAATSMPYAGKRYRSGTYTVPFTRPDNRQYTVEYRYLQNGKWIFQKKAYQNNMVLNEGTAIDEVRVYPSGAGMATYTHEPMIGVTSKTDENGRTVFYDYDAFQRLWRIRDDEGNIIEEYKYNYRTN
ncbi:hypothetical protein [Parapedobacter koreensis]|uniref:YD repeat-containing protein n=1 Tax=Parapedobacter koreensis TaxID=332977 RepID=A0A1H7UP82_9SPHI|nr:hypothetical protein [Parapedobacter koreensis]SEL98599.1 YD repeat-containing protein [Parapedobacter koreensis]